MKSVYSALQEAFKLSDDAINIRLFVHEPHRFAIPPTKNNSETYTHPELYTLISIDCFAGRSLDAKRNLYRRLVENIEVCAIAIKEHCLVNKITQFLIFHQWRFLGSMNQESQLKHWNELPVKKAFYHYDAYKIVLSYLKNKSTAELIDLDNLEGA